MLVNYEGHLGWHIVEIWDVWLDFKALSEMRDWGVVVYGAFASFLEGGRLMVFFANSYIEAKREEKQHQDDVMLALILSDTSDEVSFDEALRKVKDARRRQEVGLQHVTHKSD